MSAFDKIIGYESIKAELIRISDVLENPAKYERLGAKTPRGVLLYGKPGLGKTLMARCIIEESGRTAFVVRKDQPDGEFVKTIKETFDKAKDAAPSIILFDDLDKFANEDIEHKDAEEYVAIQSGIDSVRDDEIFVIATVNDKDNLPDSLLRAGRFDVCLEMKAPGLKDIEKIIEYYLSSKSYVDDVDCEEIASLLDGHTCAELESVINDAAILAGYAGKEKIEQEDIVKACMRVIFKAPESVHIDEKDSIMRTVAIHEAGHAVTHEVLDPGSVTLVSILRHEGETEGITNFIEPEECGYLKEYKEHQIIAKLGGRAATEIISGVMDMGVSGDIKTAVGKMIAEMETERIECNFLGYNHYVSEFSLYDRERLINQELERYYQMAKRIIAENRDFADALIEELMEKKTLRKNDIQRIKKSVTEDLL